MKKRFLVTAAGGDIGTAIVKCLKEEYAECFIIGTDLKSYIQSIHYIDYFINIPSYQDIKYIEAIKTICLENQVQYLIPTHEGEIAILAKYRNEIENYGIKLLVVGKKVCEAFNTKQSTNSFLKRIGISVPKSFGSVKEISQEDYPVIIKMNKGSGSRNMQIVYNLNDMDIPVNGEGDYIIQEYIDIEHSEYTVAVFSDGINVRHLCFRRELGYGGMSVFVESVSFEWLDELCEKVARETELVGCINLQMRIKDGIYYIFEVNARISSTVRFRYKMGFKDLIWWIDILEGNTPQYYRCPSGLIGVKTTGELIIN